MAIAASIGRGVRESAGRPALAATLWLWNVLLGLIVAVPAWGALSAAFSLAPEAEQLLERLHLAVLFEGFHETGPAVTRLLGSAFLVAATLGLLGNAFLAGGVLHVVTSGAGPTFLHRFMRGAGHFFGRFLRLLLLAVVSFLACAAAGTIVLGAVAGAMEQSGSEILSLLGSLVVLSGVLGALAFFSMALDYARVRMVLEDGRGATRAWLRSLGFVLRHLPGTVLVALAFAVASVVVLALSFAYQAGAASNAGLLIVVLFVVQQATVFVRSALRVGSLAAAVEYSQRRGNRTVPGLGHPAETSGQQPALLGPETATDHERPPTTPPDAQPGEPSQEASANDATPPDVISR